MRVSIGRILPLTCLLESKTEKTNLVPVNVVTVLPDGGGGISLLSCTWVPRRFPGRREMWVCGYRVGAPRS